MDRTDFSSFNLKIPLLYRNGGIACELIRCGGGGGRVAMICHLPSIPELARKGKK